MSTELKMPQFGASVIEATVLSWRKQVGDQIHPGDVICDIATDKVDTEIEATGEGVIRQLLIAEGETVPIGTTIAIIDSDDSTDVQADSESATVTEVGTPGGTFVRHLSPAAVIRAAGRRGSPVASPAARSIAEDRGIALSAIAGSGLDGRISAADVTSFAAPEQSVLPAGYDDVPHEIIPTSHVRKATAEHMIRSRQTAAHMTTEVDVDTSMLAAQREILNQEQVEQGLARTSYLPFLMRALCPSLAEFANLNATFEPHRYIRWTEVNLGVAVDTDYGLVVPVVRDCGALTLSAIADRLTDLTGRARAKQLTVDDLRAGTFTLSNPGSIGAVSAPAIINQPQVAVLGVPAIVRRPWAVRLSDGQETIAVRPIVRLALTFDHRAVDGAEATRCLVALKSRLESWTLSQYL